MALQLLSITRSEPLGGDSCHVRTNSVGDSSVVGLLTLSRPTDITRLVVAIVVDSIKRMFRGWPSSHIAEEVLEFPPRVANRNSPPAITRPCHSSRVSASLDHIGPNPILRGIPLPMGTKSFSGHRTLKTPTTLGVSVNQVGGPKWSNRSTVTPTNPSSYFVPCRRSLDNEQSCKHLTRKVFKRHGCS